MIRRREIKGKKYFDFLLLFVFYNIVTIFDSHRFPLSYRLPTASIVIVVRVITIEKEQPGKELITKVKQRRFRVITVLGAIDKSLIPVNIILELI